MRTGFIESEVKPLGSINQAPLKTGRMNATPSAFLQKFLTLGQLCCIQAKGKYKEKMLLSNENQKQAWEKGRFGT